MSYNKTGKITLVESGKNSMTTETYSDRKEMILDLIKSGKTFEGVGYGTFEHFKGIDELIKDIKKVRSCIKSEMITKVDYG